MLGKISYTDYFSDAEGNLNDFMPATETTWNSSILMERLS